MAVKLSGPVIQTECPAVVAADFASEIGLGREIAHLDLSVPGSIEWAIEMIVCGLLMVVVRKAHLHCRCSHLLCLSRRGSFCVVSGAGLPFSFEYNYALKYAVASACPQKY